MKRLIFAALVAASVVSPASAGSYDSWNNSGMSTSHTYYGWAVSGGRSGYIAAQPATPAERQKAIDEQRICAPVVVWTDAGKVVHPAMGCRP